MFHLSLVLQGAEDPPNPLLIHSLFLIVLTEMKSKQFERTCPSCGKSVFHTQSNHRDSAERKKKPCISCGSKGKHLGRKLSEEHKRRISEGNTNRQVSEETRQKLRLHKHTEETKNQISSTLKGRVITKEWRQKICSSARRGKDHPKYGKAPHPRSSGRGKGGIYKSFNFRSLYELRVILTLEKLHIPFHSAEHISIPYQFEDNERTYRPDFLVSSTLIEVKPKHQITWQINQIKFQAAEKWCKNNGYSFRVLALKKSNLKERKLEKISELRFYH